VVASELGERKTPRAAINGELMEISVNISGIKKLNDSKKNSEICFEKNVTFKLTAGGVVESDE
jgi:hypothetical protein